MSQHPDDERDQRPTPSDAETDAKQSENEVIGKTLNALPAPGRCAERRRSRNNAWKHGLYANDAVIREGPGQENEDEFEALYKGLLRSWEPRNQMEEREVRTLAETLWRLQRLVRAEVGEIRRQAEIDSAMLSTHRSKDISNVETKLECLISARDDVETCGYISDPFQQELDRHLGADDWLVEYCRVTSKLAQKQQEDQDLSDASNFELKQPQDGGQHGGPGPESAQGKDSSAEDFSVVDYKNDLFRHIEKRINTLKEQLENLKTEQRRWREACLLAYRLPSKEFSERLIRSETALEKKKKRCIELLLLLKGKKT